MDTHHNIAASLRALGITQAALADELGVSTSTVATVVTGKSKSYPVQKAIAQKLNSTIEALWPGQVRLRRNRAEIEAARNAT
jgi:lambda repressor-like predicted transcriptional regulator